MIRFCTLIALLPFLLSISFALPIGYTPLGLSPTSLQFGRPIIQSQGPNVMPAAKRARFLTRGEKPLIESVDLLNEALRLANDPNADPAALEDAMRKGTEALSKLGSSTGDGAKVEASTGNGAKVANKPPYRFPWPASRLNLTPTDPSNPTQSTSGNKVSWPSK
ncbi:hypothetical protein A4X13_0g526 [Tilletia indica]|uniref:Uncharacterized protein n=1 Tax=Tilletia indica TaxID=43049 RepID=A0A8T8TEZ5_9BASI|nr:hypothetical protein A4X13_0g526 [Tilletia indica]